MSKLNEEIIDVLQIAREYIFDDTPPNIEGARRQRKGILRRLDRVMNVFLAIREVEECRRDDE